MGCLWAARSITSGKPCRKRFTNPKMCASSSHGHTHGYKVFPLRTVQKDNQPFDQLYLNSGTWHPLHDLGHDQSEGRGFIFHKTMTYLSFYKDAERKGRLYETWSGTLDM